MNHSNSFNCARAVFVFTVTVVMLALGNTAVAELRDFEGMELQGRDYHSRLHNRGRCTACHEQSAEDVTGYPEDGACLGCHEVEGLVADTMPEAEEDRWQNPHDNLHWGTDVPCSECHAEHSTKEPLCADCHNFDYPNHQK